MHLHGTSIALPQLFRLSRVFVVRSGERTFLWRGGCNRTSFCYSFLLQLHLHLSISLVATLCSRSRHFLFRCAFYFPTRRPRRAQSTLLPRIAWQFSLRCRCTLLAARTQLQEQTQSSRLSTLLHRAIPAAASLLLVQAASDARTHARSSRL